MSKKSGVLGKTPFQVERAISAATRKEQRAARSTEEQLAVLDKRPGQSLRERARLAR